MSYSTRYNSRFVLSGHRGGSPFHTENTLEAFLWLNSKLEEVNKNNMELMIETDVHLTKDKVLVCYHDKNIKRLTGEDKLIKDCDFHYLKTLSYQQDSKEKGTLCSVKDLFKNTKGVYYSIDIKQNEGLGIESRKELIALAKEYGVIEKLNIASFHKMIELESIYDTDRKYCITGCEKTVRSAGLMYIFSKNILPAFKDLIVDQLDVPVSHPMIKFYTYSWAKYTHKRGAITFIWDSVKNPLTDIKILKAFQNDIDGIHVDNVENALKILKLLTKKRK